MRTTRRPRRYVRSETLTLISPLFGYDSRRDAYTLRGVGRRVGPVFLEDRRRRHELPPGLIDLRQDARPA
jgi:hypothetical protein